MVRIVARDRVINAIKSSAAEANSKHTVEPIALDRSGPVTKRYRHRAVLVDGWDVEQVHHLRNVKSARRPGGLAYTMTTLHRGRLARGHWTIFFVDAVGFPQRVIRSRNSRLLKDFFADGQTRVSIYIPLDGRPSNPRYDFLGDEDRWSSLPFLQSRRQTACVPFISEEKIAFRSPTHPPVPRQTTGSHMPSAIQLWATRQA